MFATNLVTCLFSFYFKKETLLDKSNNHVIFTLKNETKTESSSTRCVTQNEIDREWQENTQKLDFLVGSLDGLIPFPL